MRWVKRIFGGLAVLIGVALAGLWIYPPELFRVATGYTAKIVCSNRFIASRDPAEIQKIDVQAPGHPVLKLVTVKVDDSEGWASAALLGFIARTTAIAQTGHGCTLVPSGDLKAVARVAIPDRTDLVNFTWPMVADPRLDAVLDDADLTGTGMRAVVVVKDGVIVGERYADGFTAETPLLGWSMTKSVTSLLVGRAIGEGKLSLDQAALFPEWAGDDRAKIRLRDLLGMESGLAWNEGYGDVSDVTRMLFLDDDFTKTPRRQPVEAAPGTVFEYSSGTTNLIAKLLQDAVGEGAGWPNAVLFNPLGMTSAELEVDAAGTLGGSSWLYASARDWAKLGQLWLNGGQWGNQQVVPRDYIEWMSVPTKASDGEYGQGQIWIEKAEDGLPQGTMRFSGHDGQFVTIVPSERLVIVRLGLTPSRLGWKVQPLSRAVIAALR